jgi:hypothetical protein
MMVSECCHKKQQITTNSTSIDIFICYTIMHNTINNFQSFSLHPGHYQTSTLHRTYEKNHTVVHILIQERELTPLKQTS